VTSEAAELVVYTTGTCGQCWALKSWLKTRQVAFREIDIEDDPDARRLVRKAAGGYLSVPILVLPDGRVLVEPRHDEVAAALASGG
jgi:mycoredoxin